MRTVLISGFWGLLALIWIFVGSLYFLGSRPMSDDTNLQVFEVEPGMTLKRVSQKLSSQNLIRSASAFQAIGLIQNKQKLIMAGEYHVSPSMLPLEIMERITSGKTVLHPVTIPEGYRITEIAALLEEQGLADKEVFLKQVKNFKLVEGVPTGSLEGYLFPETYHFGKSTSETTIVKKMVATFKERAWKKDFLNRAREIGFSFHEIITLASLIEKETGKDSERKQISSVFHNRLKKNMRLQTDPTVIYAIENFDGNIRKRDLKIDSPYNTYRYKGLPPGPIASPGLKSIVAALYPADTPNLYFVSRQDGSHQFSATLNEHNRAVQKYQLRRVGG
ncbi:MAG: endolytic transglycosylase MltG [Nitrospinae bacterium]|nr:endolytic transglycosylase MltG [Nitrospinota bacterium]MZH04271.1 endolytic transglycosylase MltG [Nitrospinota bacterium]MZH15340.1 endolytic transglycosylase MltG [Nitrospinota bacterium]